PRDGTEDLESPGCPCASGRSGYDFARRRVRPSTPVFSPLLNGQVSTHAHPIPTNGWLVRLDGGSVSLRGPRGDRLPPAEWYPAGFQARAADLRGRRPRPSTSGKERTTR